MPFLRDSFIHYSTPIYLPAHPPCVRVRTRRFEMVTLVRILQIRETERFEIGRGKRNG
jgi:hypothetical protein